MLALCFGQSCINVSRHIIGYIPVSVFEHLRPVLKLHDGNRLRASWFSLILDRRVGSRSEFGIENPSGGGGVVYLWPFDCSENDESAGIAR